MRGLSGCQGEWGERGERGEEGGRGGMGGGEEQRGGERGGGRPRTLSPHSRSLHLKAAGSIITRIHNGCRGKREGGVQDCKE